MHEQTPQDAPLGTAEITALTVIMVEDCAKQAADITAAFARHGDTVIWVWDPADFLAIANANVSRIDGFIVDRALVKVISRDVCQPNDGLVKAWELRRDVTFAYIPIVVYSSGWNSEDRLDEPWFVGQGVFLCDSCAGEDIRNTLLKVLGRGPWQYLENTSENRRLSPTANRRSD